MITVNGISKKYGDHYAVKNLSFEIEKGKVYGFLGPNGAGKTTTMNIMTGYIAASDGSVTVNGHDIVKEAEEAKKCMGYLPELPPLYQDMTVKEYLKFVAELKNVKKTERNKQIDDVMKKTFIIDMQNRLIKNLSKGYKQRVGLAQAMLGNPEVIILDEPTVGLDPKQIIEIRELIRNLKKDHTVILSSHILSEVAEVCDELMIIARGRLVAGGTEAELMEELGEGNTIELSLGGDKKTVESVVSQIKNIKSYKTDSQQKGRVKCVISVNEGEDINSELCKKLVEKDITIYGLVSSSKTLEDIFLELTDDRHVDELEKKEAEEEAARKAEEEKAKAEKKAEKEKNKADKTAENADADKTAETAESETPDAEASDEASKIEDETDKTDAKEEK
ncbi:MAG: ABC transporter ATP-binding protein [Lachnospiraceae bacterium]|nr:ABC transporter ATP-binding protein [Lachnospiraceae bacterium]